MRSLTVRLRRLVGLTLQDGALRRLWGLLKGGGLRGLVQRLSQLGEGVSYPEWAAARRLTAVDRSQIQDHIQRLAFRPRISILLPVYNSRPVWLRACLDSVLAQLYPSWELCIADDCSTRQAVRAILQEYAGRDARIKLVQRAETGNVSAATNSALALATGDFVAFLDHDDTLCEHALYLAAAWLNEHPETDLIYSDEDRIDGRGRVLRPVFKPGWSPDLLRAHNYINHLTVLRTALARAAGGLRIGLEGAQDYDLLLRISERITDDRIHHLAEVLYHWRDHAVSISQLQPARTAAIGAFHRAIGDSLDRQRLDAEVLDMTANPSLHRVRFRLPEPPPLVSVIIPTHDRLDLLFGCVEGLRQATAYPAIEIIVIDHASSDPATVDYLQALAQQPHTRVLRQEGDFNYAALSNAGAALAQGDVLCFLNNDIAVRQAGWLAELVSLALRPEIGAAGPLLRHPDGRVQSQGIQLGTNGIARLAGRQLPGQPPPSAFQLQQISNVAALTGACLVMRRALFEEVGGFDEELAVAYNDIDLCLNLRAAGRWLVFTPFSELVHVHSASRGPEDTPEKQARLKREADYLIQKWGKWATTDPFINPNLDWSQGRPELAISCAQLRPWQRITKRTTT